MITIRKATESDAKHISSLGKITYMESHGDFFKNKHDLKVYCNETFSLKKIEKSLSNPNNVFWIAFVKEVPVGYAKLKLHSTSDFIDSENICQLQKIYVLKDYISMKIGFRLQNMLLEEAITRKFERIWLSVYHKNYRAVEFYKKNSFYQVGNYIFKIGTASFELMVLSKRLA